METIEATFPPSVEPSFKTSAEAIAFSKSIAHARETKDVASCVGRLIRVAEWRDDAVFLHLDNRKVLRFGCAQSIVDLTIEEGTKSNVACESQTQGECLLRLADEEFHWKRGELMQALEDNTVHRIQAGQTLFFLYVTNVGILMISVLINRLTGRPFVYWGLTD